MAEQTGSSWTNIDLTVQWHQITTIHSKTEKKRGIFMTKFNHLNIHFWAKYFWQSFKNVLNVCLTVIKILDLYKNNIMSSESLKKYWLKIDYTVRLL